MKTKNALLWGSFLLLGFYSCKKEKDESPVPTTSASTTANYCPRTVGSYWIYDTYNLDTNGVETFVSTDSTYISNDSVIGGNSYSVFHGSAMLPGNIYCRRDSSGYFIDQYGGSYFSATNFTDTLRTTTVPGFLVSYAKMVLPAASITVPAGTYNTYDCMVTTNIVQPGYLWDTTRYTHHYFADGVGQIYETMFFLSSPNYIVRKLVRYHIQ